MSCFLGRFLAKEFYAIGPFEVTVAFFEVMMQSTLIECIGIDVYC